MRTISYAASLCLLLGLTACVKGGRFGSCESHDDCLSKDEQEAGVEDGTKLRYCVNVRCVECRTDKDCEAGSACNRKTLMCESVR